MARTLTAANSILTLSIPGLFDSPVLIQGFATDAVSDTDSVQPAETMMGVDGNLSAGWIPVPIVQNYNIQADSDSIDIFEQWYQTQQQIQEILRANGMFVVQSLGVKYTHRRGILTGYVPTANLQKVAQPRKFSITWEGVTSAPI